MTPTINELTTERRIAKPASGRSAPQLPELGGDVAEVRVLPVELGEDPERRVEVARGLVCRREVVAQALVLLLAPAGGLQALLEPLDRELGHALLHEADAQHAA